MSRRTVYYVVMQDITREVFRSDNWNDCIDYLKSVKEEFDQDYMVRFNEKDGTLLLQDITTGNFITSLSIRILDERSTTDTRYNFDVVGDIQERMKW